MNAASTGINEKTAKAEGIPYDYVYIIGNDKVGLMPDSNPMHFKLIYEYPTGRILGAQAIGRGNVDKRIDVVATLIHMGGTLEDMKELELCYAPYSGQRGYSESGSLGGSEHPTRTVQTGTRIQGKELVEKCFYRRREGRGI